MGCGALVVGFHGYGGSEFMKGEEAGDEQNCILIENGNQQSFIQKLDEVLEKIEKQGRQQYDWIIQNAHKVIKDLTVKPEEEGKLITNTFIVIKEKHRMQLDQKRKRQEKISEKKRKINQKPKEKQKKKR